MPKKKPATLSGGGQRQHRSRPRKMREQVPVPPPLERLGPAVLAHGGLVNDHFAGLGAHLVPLPIMPLNFN